jgi:AbrB family looped-hinge helix DNA binding protein
MAAIVHMNPAGRITIPASTRRALNLAAEAELEATVEDGALVLRPVLVLRQEDAWAYTPQHRELLRRAHDDSREGRYREMTEEQFLEVADGDA